MMIKFSDLVPDLAETAAQTREKERKKEKGKRKKEKRKLRQIVWVLSMCHGHIGIGLPNMEKTTRSRVLRIVLSAARRKERVTKPLVIV